MSSERPGPQLERFVTAQEHSYPGALAELQRGRKTGHWMWFVFPQLAGLGVSATSVAYAIADLEEARAYLSHPVLGPRLREISTVVADSEVDAETMLGSIDAVKLRSSMTLFSRADPAEPVFTAVLDRCFGGAEDEVTSSRL